MSSTRIAAFTLLELLIVIAITGILASLLVPGLLAAQRRSFDVSAQACGKSIQTAQAIAQVDTKSFLLIGLGTGNLNRNTDAVNAACGFSDVFIKERSNAATIASSYAIDVWDRRGKNVFTVTPDSVDKGASGATSFSNTGTNGFNLP